jgi:hypothetical protein
VPSAFLADVVVAGHFAFLVFVIFGGLLAVRRPWSSVVHLPALVWGAWIELTGGVCPLTPLENRLRRAAGQAGYEETFIEHYIVPLVYPPGLTQGIQVALGIALILFNALVYGWVVHRWRRARSTSAC